MSAYAPPKATPIASRSHYLWTRICKLSSRTLLTALGTTSSDRSIPPSQVAASTREPDATVSEYDGTPSVHDVTGEPPRYSDVPPRISIEELRPAMPQLYTPRWDQSDFDTAQIVRMSSLSFDFSLHGTCKTGSSTRDVASEPNLSVLLDVDEGHPLVRRNTWTVTGEITALTTPSWRDPKPEGVSPRCSPSKASPEVQSGARSVTHMSVAAAAFDAGTDDRLRAAEYSSPPRRDTKADKEQ